MNCINTHYELAATCILIVLFDLDNKKENNFYFYFLLEKQCEQRASGGWLKNNFQKLMLAYQLFHSCCLSIIQVIGFLDKHTFTANKWD